MVEDMLANPGDTTAAIEKRGAKKKKTPAKPTEWEFGVRPAADELVTSSCSYCGFVADEALPLIAFWHANLEPSLIGERITQIAKLCCEALFMASSARTDHHVWRKWEYMHDASSKPIRPRMTVFVGRAKCVVIRRVVHNKWELHVHPDWVADVPVDKHVLLDVIGSTVRIVEPTPK